MNTFDRNTLDSNKYNSIDFFKFIMAFLVVGIHTGLVDFFEGELVRKAVFQILNLGVPFFFLASGYLLASKMSLNDKNRIDNSDDGVKSKRSSDIRKIYPYGSKADRAILWHHMIKVLKLYLIWMTIYLPMTIYTYARGGLGIAQSVFLIVKGYILTGELENAWHFWYMLSTIYALLIIILLMKLRVPLKVLLFFSFLASICGAVLQILPSYEGELPMALNLLRFFMLAGFVNNRIMNGLIYIPIGMQLYRARLNISISAILLFAGYVGSLFTSSELIKLYLLIISSIALFCLVSRIKLHDSPKWTLFRNMSTYIYIIHMYMWTIYYTIVYKEESYGLDCFIVSSAMSLVFAYLFIKLKLKFQNKDIKPLS